MSRGETRLVALASIPGAAHWPPTLVLSSCEMIPNAEDKQEFDGTVFAQLTAVSLAEGVVAALKDAFFSGRLKRGAAIVERQIATQMNVGTPVVREPLISLKHERFVRRMKHKATFITRFNTDEVRQLDTS